MENKNEILSNLYALRAGMSAISQEKDKVDNYNRATRQSEEESKKAKKGFNSKIKKKTEEIEQEKEKLKQEEETDVLLFAIKQGPGVFFLVTATITFVIALALGIGIISTLVDPSNDPNFGEIIFHGIFTIAAALWTRFVVSWLLSEIKDCKAKNARIESEKASAPVTIKKKDAEITSLKQAITETDNKHKLCCSQYRDKTATCVQTSMNLNQVLINEHSKTLDPRDWQHIDLIIFYFETGRADNMKEALQLVDRQVQNNAIVNAINMAGSLIQSTIQAGFADLQVTMVKCFVHISNQLDQISSGIETQNAQLERISQKIDLGNSLREKANTNSLRLMQDVNYMRNLAENAEYRRKNNM